MTSYASSAASSGPNLRQYMSSQGGNDFGQAAYDRARAGGMTDEQIRRALQSQGLNPGVNLAPRLGMTRSTGGGGGGGGNTGFQTLAGQNVNSGMALLTGIANKYADNSSIVNMVVGKQADLAATQANMGLQLNYQSSMAGTLADIQFGLENLRAGNAMKMIGAEGAIAKDIASLDSETRLGIGKMQLEGVKYGADKSLEGAKYTSDRSLEGTKYASDRSLEGTKYTADESTRRVRVQGDEDRKTLGENTLQTLRLRQDARTAIRNTGSRFYA
jgi:hypothetical protein